MPLEKQNEELLKNKFMEKSIVQRKTPGPPIESVMALKWRFFRTVVLIRSVGGKLRQESLGYRMVEFVTPYLDVFPSNTILVNLQCAGHLSRLSTPLDVAPLYIELDAFTPYCLSTSKRHFVACVPKNSRSRDYFVPAGYYNRKLLYSEIGINLDNLLQYYPTE